MIRRRLEGAAEELVIAEGAQLHECLAVDDASRSSPQFVPFPVDAITNFYQGDFTEMVTTKGMAQQLYEQSGIAPSDIQVAQLYDHFTPILLQHLEGWGFCDKGEAMDFVRDGNCELDGRLPLNTHGGLIGEAYIHGLNSAAEAVTHQGVNAGIAKASSAAVTSALKSARVSSTGLLRRCSIAASPRMQKILAISRLKMKPTPKYQT